MVSPVDVRPDRVFGAQRYGGNGTLPSKAVHDDANVRAFFKWGIES